MASFGENDRLRVVADLARFGESMLDGRVLMVPQPGQEVDEAALAQLIETAYREAKRLKEAE